MILQIEQTSKELYEAAFRIRRGDNGVGVINVHGSIGKMEADARIEIFEKRYLLTYDGNGFGPGSRECRRNEKETAYRTYLINGGDAGRVCQVERKTGLFSTAEFREMTFENKVIRMYSKSFQTEGKNSVYCGEEQIAQIDTSSEIVDDMFHYQIYADGQRSAEIAVLYCVYMYLLTGFQPGQKVRKGVHKQVTIAFDKTFDDKYNPEFVRKIEQ